MQEMARPKASYHPAQQGRNQQIPYNQALNEVIKKANNPEAAKLKEEIDGIRKQRGSVIVQIKDTRRRLGYKEAESIALERLLEIEKKNGKGNEKRRQIGQLKRLKNRLEFKISTEATSLAAEKDLVRKIEEVNRELTEAYKSIRLERKSQFIKGDIDAYKKRLAELEAKITETDKVLDALYEKLRRILGIKRERKEEKHYKKVQPKQQSQEINLEDIAVIKKKEKKVEQKEDE
jgi:uncharacterized coiled-coil DUF342 family protein